MKKTAGLLAVDIDGTLITDHGEITSQVYDALERTVARDWEVVIASGRTYYAARSIVEKLPFVRYAVTSNGASILHLPEMDVVYCEVLSPDTVAEAVRIMREHGAVPALYNSRVEAQTVFYDTIEGACDLFTWYVGRDPRFILVDDSLAYTEGILQIGTIEAREVIFALKEELAVLGVTVMTLPFESTHFGGKNQNYWFLQIVGKNAWKNIALRRLAAMLEIPPGAFVAVGDNYNDADMIAGADIGVAMGNAPDEIKELAEVVVASNNCSGLAQVVEDIILSGDRFS